MPNARPNARPRPPESIAGMKYDYWICQKQLCHGHLLARVGVKLNCNDRNYSEKRGDLTSLYSLMADGGRNVRACRKISRTQL